MGKVGAMMLDQAAQLATIEGIHRLSLLDLNEESDLEMTWNSLHTVKDEIRKRSRRRRKLLSILWKTSHWIRSRPPSLVNISAPTTATWPVHVVKNFLWNFSWKGI